VNWIVGSNEEGHAGASGRVVIDQVWPTAFHCILVLILPFQKRHAPALLAVAAVHIVFVQGGFENHGTVHLRDDAAELCPDLPCNQLSAGQVRAEDSDNRGPSVIKAHHPTIAGIGQVVEHIARLRAQDAEMPFSHLVAGLSPLGAVARYLITPP